MVSVLCVVGEGADHGTRGRVRSPPHLRRHGRNPAWGDRNVTAGSRAAIEESVSIQGCEAVNSQTTKAGAHYRGRLAPSPTGYLHLGHARTFWMAQERVRARVGTLVLRNEDLDPQRSKPEFVTAMIEDLRWFGLV
jgi:hypothetical protein